MHGTVVRPTTYLASLDVKTAFDKAKPKHMAKILDGHNTNGWLVTLVPRDQAQHRTSLSNQDKQLMHSLRNMDLELAIRSLEKLHEKRDLPAGF